MPVSDIDTAKTEQDLRDARDDAAGATTDGDRNSATRRVDIAQAKLDAVRRAALH